MSKHRHRRKYEIGSFLKETFLKEAFYSLSHTTQSNKARKRVNFSKLVDCESFRKCSGSLPMMLGTDIDGQPFIADLTEMSHLCVGAVDTGDKRVCLNTILLSFLSRLHPKDLRLLLIDSKRNELADYADLPHLVHPVITEMTEAPNALHWAILEMDRRYELMHRLPSRDISQYNQKLAAYGSELPSDLADLQHLPYLVIVSSELEDMRRSSREIETKIVWLTRLGRGAGILVRLATQHADIKVFTRTIKDKFRWYISCIGEGDMLIKKDWSGHVQPVQAPSLSDDEVQAVVAHWRNSGIDISGLNQPTLLADSVSKLTSG